MIAMREVSLDPWKSPVSYNAQHMAMLVRMVMDKIGWEYERETGEKVYDRIMVVMPLMRFAHVYRFVVNKPVEITIDTYDTRPTHSSYIPWMAIEEMEPGDIPKVRELLDGMLAELERPPWIFTPRQRLNHGYFMPEFKQARRAWHALGYDSFKKWKPAKKKKEKADDEI
ncbi:MAG: hypothetical protein QCI38_04790 [Candidatus Thermoplasmatota archaeon]|nr:hypothetical protein [Candidatus Thermoplasmatota archaeon]